MRLGHWVKHFLIYGSGVILTNALPFILIPIYTRAVTPSEYGVLELLNRSQEFLLLFASFGLRSTLLTLYQMAKEDAEKRKRLYATALQFLVISSLAIILPVALATGAISTILFGGDNYRRAVLIILASTYFETLFQIAVLYLQSELKSAMYVGVFAARASATVILASIFIYGMGYGLMGILLISLAQTMLASLLLLGYVFSRTGLGFNREMLWDMMKFGLPLMPGAFATFILNNGDRYFLNIYTTRDQVGIYGLGYRLGMVTMSLILLPFGKIWSVTMVDMSRAEDGPSRLGKVATYLVAACAFSTLALSLWGPYVVRVADPRYWESYKIIPIVGAAYLFYAWATIMDASFYVTKKTGYKPLVVLSSSAIMLGFYWLLIPRYGMMGAAWATLLGYAAFGGITLYFAQRIYRIVYEYGRLALVVAIAVVLYVIGERFPANSFDFRLAVRSILILAMPAILWSTGIINESEREAMRGYWNALRAKLTGEEVEPPTSAAGL